MALGTGDTRQLHVDAGGRLYEKKDEGIMTDRKSQAPDRRWTASWQLFGSTAYGKETLWHFYIPFTRVQIWVVRKRTL